MYKIKDFYLKRIYNIKGKRLGVVKDVFIDFNKANVLGLEVSNYTLMNKKNYLSVNNIINFHEEIISKDLDVYKGLKFSDIKDLEIYDKNGKIKGEVEDLIIGEEDFKIKGIVISTGIVDKIIKGKQIILINECVLGDNFILYLGDGEIVVKNLPHHIDTDVQSEKA